MPKSVRVALSGALAVLALGVGVALPAAAAMSPQSCPDYTWKWKGGPPADGPSNG